jgi:divalent metal cation (Fe/Co/Zn/Cd) transporter
LAKVIISKWNAIIGIILMVFAFFLAKENKALLVGEAISKKDYRRIVELVHKIPGVNRLISLWTMYFAAEDVLVAMDVTLKDGLTTDEIESVIDHIEQRAKQVIPYIRRSKIYVEVEQDSCSINWILLSRLEPPKRYFYPEPLEDNKALHQCMASICNKTLL